jgi:hypothetical protein
MLILVLRSLRKGHREEERRRLKPLAVEYRCGIRWRTGP